MTQLLFHLLAPILIVSVGWGLSPILEKYILNYISYEEIYILYGLLFGSIALIYFIYLKFYKKKIMYNQPKFNKIVPIIIISGLLTFILGDYFYFKSLKNNKVSIVILLISILPTIITTVMSQFLLGESYSVEYYFGIILCFIGFSIIIKHT